MGILALGPGVSSIAVQFLIDLSSISLPLLEPIVQLEHGPHRASGVLRWVRRGIAGFRKAPRGKVGVVWSPCQAGGQA
jgi:hypothetical protein